jgi:uncharacterized membrane protein (UPF0127 family)
MQNKETKKTESAPKPITQKSPLILILVSITIIVLLISGFTLLKQRVERVDYKKVTIAGKVFKLELADTDSKRADGLSQRDNIPSDGGMFFDFNTDGDWRMWMLQMRFPIDIVWLANDGKVVGIKNSAQPGEYPEIYRAEQLSRYAIEVQAGTAKQLDLKEGDTVQIK